MTYPLKALLLAGTVLALGAGQNSRAQDRQSQNTNTRNAGSHTRTTKPDALQDIILVHGQRRRTPTRDAILPERQHRSGPDTASLLTRSPGAAVNRSGRLSSQVQYRGLFGARINVRVNNRSIAPGGPGWMDPPLHYAPASLIARLEVDRGISPVSAGPGLGGGVNAVLKRTDFTDTRQMRTGYDWEASASSVDDGKAMGGMAGIANKSFRLNALYSLEDGGDLRFPGGRIAGTSYHRLHYGIETGVRARGQTLSLSLRKQETGDSGNPPFPMDIHFFDSGFVDLDYDGQFDGLEIRAGLGLADIAHGMSNFRLRPAPSAMRQRETFARSFKRTANISAVFDWAGGRMQVGADTDYTKNKARITNPNRPGFFLDNVPHITRRRTGAFVQWTGALARLNAELGARFDRHSFKAGKAGVGPSVPAMPLMLARMYNASDRSFHETNSDFVARLWTDMTPSITLRATLARKSRAPGYLDRFAWLPTTASAGLADGNIYIGNPDIRSEQAWIINAGFDYQSARAYLRPTVYLRRVDHYIQGVAFDETVGVIDSPQEMVARMNGDPTPLKFANVDAEIYGLDLDFGLVVAEMKDGADLRLDGVAAWARGKRRDIRDDLYRFAPPSLSLSASYERARWSVGVEARFVGRQNHVSLTNAEQATPGHVVFGLFSHWQINDKVQIGGGVENLLNKSYTQHLAGYNRNSGGPVPPGARLPGAGRGVYVRLSLKG